MAAAVFDIVVLFCAAFCVYAILLAVMTFSGEFATERLQPLFGLSSFLLLAGWMMLAFGPMFPAPVIVVLAVQFHFVSGKSLRRKGRYVTVIILLAAGLLILPDVIRQLMLAVPMWLLFEIGLVLAARAEARRL